MNKVKPGRTNSKVQNSVTIEDMHEMVVAISRSAQAIITNHHECQDLKGELHNAVFSVRRNGYHKQTHNPSIEFCEELWSGCQCTHVEQLAEMGGS